eukprot:7065087-Pyramimonas_sp.AAC.1
MWHLPPYTAAAPTTSAVAILHCRLSPPPRGGAGFVAPRPSDVSDDFSVGSPAPSDRAPSGCWAPSDRAPSGGGAESTRPERGGGGGKLRTAASVARVCGRQA